MPHPLFYILKLNSYKSTDECPKEGVMKGNVFVVPSQHKSVKHNRNMFKIDAIELDIMFRA
jgi:hypothetical protein